MQITKSVLNWIGRKIMAATYKDKDGFLVDYLLGGSRTVSGENVSNDSALRISAVYACINSISQDIAKIPLKVYQTVGEGKEKRYDHPSYRLLQRRPNPEMSAYDFRRTLTAHCLGWGNGYAAIERDIYGKIASLWPLRPDRVDLKRDKDKRLIYEVTSDTGQKEYFWAEEILHIKGLGFDGVKGYNVIHYAKECLGAAIAVEKQGAAFFGNGATPGGVLEHPGQLSKDAQKRLTESFEKRHQGASNSSKIMVAEEGMKFNSVSIPAKDSQFIETRQFSIPEICRWFRIPPHKIADLSKSAFSNIEQQSLDYVSDSLMGWCVGWEQEIWAKLFSQQEQNTGYFAEHVLEGLLRGDLASRYAAYAIARNWGILNANECRDKENLNPYEGGEKYLVPLNMTTAENAGQPVQGNPVDTIVNDISNRIDKAEMTELKKHVKHAGNNTAWREWIISFYKKHNEYVKKAIAPLGMNIEPQSLTLESMITDSQKPVELIDFVAPINSERIKTIIKGCQNEA